MAIYKPIELDFGNQKFSVLIYGAPGVGKSTLAFSAPNAIMFDLDKGIQRVNARHRQLVAREDNYEELLGDIESEDIKTELRTGQGIAVTYSNGTKMPTDKYAEMLARTTRIETHNIALLGKALDDGNDLVECSTISPTCPTCAIYQGRIYSISGNTPGYPALYKTAFRNGYSCIHPNCRHQFFPYNPKFHTAEERAQLEKDTRRPMDEEKQSDSARSAYARSQMQMRQWNKEMNEFSKMQAQYSKRGEESPYKSLGSFRRAYRSEEGSLAYAKTHYYHRDERQFAEFEIVIGKENMPQTLAEFQQMKYNKDSKFFRDLQEFKGYRKDNPKATKIDFETAKRIKEIGVKGEIHIPPQRVKTEDFSFDDGHINKARNHNITRKEAERFILNSKVSITQWKGQRVLFISDDGATCIDLKTNLIVTSFGKTEFDSNYKKILKEFKNDE